MKEKTDSSLRIVMKKFIYFYFLFISCSFSGNSSYQKYVRKEYAHWSDFDRDCQNTRQEILIARSKTKVLMNYKNCKVKEGTWEDYYYPQIHNLAKNVDIDHLVPLKHAHDMGGYLWSKKIKEKFANDPQNLVITDRKYNREKGSKRIDQWLPVNKNYACKYIKDWIKVKNNYSLKFTEEEKKTISQIRCD